MLFQAGLKQLKGFMQKGQGTKGKSTETITMLFMSKQVSLPKIRSILQKMKIDQNSIYALFARSPSIFKTKNCCSYSSYFSYNKLMLSDSHRVPIICILFLDFLCVSSNLACITSLL